MPVYIAALFGGAPIYECFKYGAVLGIFGIQQFGVPLHGEHGTIRIFNGLDNAVHCARAYLQPIAYGIERLMMKTVDKHGITFGYAVHIAARLNGYAVRALGSGGALIMADIAGYLAGDILIKRAAEGNVYNLYAAAYAEYGLFLCKRGMDKGYFKSVVRAAGGAYCRHGLLAVYQRRYVRAAGYNYAVHHAGYCINVGNIGYGYLDGKPAHGRNGINVAGLGNKTVVLGKVSAHYSYTRFHAYALLMRCF
jgi:hypothetical protein